MIRGHRLRLRRSVGSRGRTQGAVHARRSTRRARHGERARGARGERRVGADERLLRRLGHLRAATAEVRRGRLQQRLRRAGRGDDGLCPPPGEDVRVPERRLWLQPPLRVPDQALRDEVDE